MPFLPLLTQNFGATDVNAPFQSVLLSFQDVTLPPLGSSEAFWEQWATVVDKRGAKTLCFEIECKVFSFFFRCVSVLFTLCTARMKIKERYCTVASEDHFHLNYCIWNKCSFRQWIEITPSKSYKRQQEESHVATAWCGVKRKRKFVPVHAMKAYVRVEVNLHAFLISALDGHGRSASRPGLFTAVE